MPVPGLVKSKRILKTAPSSRASLVMVRFPWNRSWWNVMIDHILSTRNTSTGRWFQLDKNIENAFGFYKGRWHVVVKNDIRDPSFMRDVALACASLHNACKRANCLFNVKWIVNAIEYVQVDPAITPVPPRKLARGLRRALRTYPVRTLDSGRLLLLLLPVCWCVQWYNNFETILYCISCSELFISCTIVVHWSAVNPVWSYATQAVQTLPHAVHVTLVSSSSA